LPQKRDGTAEENNVAARIEGLMLILKQKQIELEAERRAKQKAEELCLSVQSQLEEAGLLSIWRCESTVSSLLLRRARRPQRRPMRRTSSWRKCARRWSASTTRTSS
jgi:hypothetical protein